MRITGVETFPVANPNPDVGGPVWMFLRLDTDGGVSGYGEMFTSPTYGHPTTVAQLLEDVVEDFVVGRSPTQTEAIFHSIYNSQYSHTGELLKASMIAAIDTACWDIAGKATGLPICELFGGQVRPKVRMYSYVYPPPGERDKSSPFWQSPERIAEAALALVDQGFSAVKLDPFPSLGGLRTMHGQLVPVQLSLEHLDLGEDIIAKLRGALGSRSDVILGTHGQMTASGAIRLARRLERYDPLWFEEPVPPELPGEMAKVARATTIPITAGERLTSKWDFARLVREEAASILNLDLSLVGLLEGRKIGALAEANYLQVSPHCYGGPLVAAASVQFASAAPNFLIMEGNGTYGGIYEEILDEPLHWEEGYLVPSTRPGLGHNLNEELARKLAVAPGHRFPSAQPASG